MIGDRCIATQCENEELCQTIKAKPTKKVPKIAYIRRKEKNQNPRGKISYLETEKDKCIHTRLIYVLERLKHQ